MDAETALKPRERGDALNPNGPMIDPRGNVMKRMDNRRSETHGRIAAAVVGLARCMDSCCTTTPCRGSAKSAREGGLPRPGLGFQRA